MLQLRWQVVSKPAGSDAHFAGPKQGTESLLSLERSSEGIAHPELVTDRVGRYVVRLTVGSRGHADSDTVSVEALYPSAAVPIDTHVDGTAPGGPRLRGIAIGYHPAAHGYAAPVAPEQFYPLPAGDRALALVLDRQTLQFVASQSFPAGLGFPTELGAFLQPYNQDDSKLVIVSAWADPAWQVSGQFPIATLLTQPAGVFAAGPLNMIGAQPISSDQAKRDGALVTSNATWIGVPGRPAGTAWERMSGGLIDAGDDPGLDGYLVQNDRNNYVYYAPAGVPFDLGPGGNSSVTMKAGSGTYTASLPAGAMGGFAVLTFQAGDISNGQLTGFNLSNPKAPGTPLKVYVTRNADGSPNYTGLSQLHADISAYNGTGAGSPAGPLDIMVRSIGAPIPAYSGSDATLAAALKQLAADIASLGGYKNSILALAQANNTTPPQSYSLVGRNNLSEGAAPAVEISSVTTTAPTTVNASTFELSGRLDRDAHSLFAPGQATATGTSRDNPLPAAVTSEPVPWPDSSTAGERLALKCIGNAAELGPNPRIAYWVDPSKAEQGVGGVTLADAQESCPTGSPTLSGQDFDTVKAELTTEIGWVKKVYSYFSDLSSPFTGTAGLKNYSGLEEIANTIKGQFTPEITDQETSFNAFELFGTLIGGIGAAAEIEDPLFGVLGYLFDAASQFTDAPSTAQGPSVFAQRQTITTTADQIAADYASQMQTVADNYTLLAQMVVSDYDRLKLVAKYGGCVAGSPGCTPGWQFTVQDRNAASEQLEYNAKRTAWAGLMPVAWPYVLHTTSNVDSYGGSNWAYFNGTQDQIGGISCYPQLGERSFYGFPQFTYSPADQYPATDPVVRPSFITEGLFENGNTQPFMVFATNNFLGYDTYYFPLPANTFPSDKLLKHPTDTNPPFGPLDPDGNPDNQAYGLGIDEYEFMIDNWPSDHRPQWMGCHPGD